LRAFAELSDVARRDVSACAVGAGRADAGATVRVPGGEHRAARHGVIGISSAKTI